MYWRFAVPLLCLINPSRTLSFTDRNVNRCNLNTTDFKSLSLIYLSRMWNASFVKIFYNYRSECCHETKCGLARCMNGNLSIQIARPGNKHLAMYLSLMVFKSIFRHSLLASVHLGVLYWIPWTYTALVQRSWCLHLEPFSTIEWLWQSNSMDFCTWWCLET